MAMVEVKGDSGSELTATWDGGNESTTPLYMRAGHTSLVSVDYSAGDFALEVSIVGDDAYTPYYVLGAPTITGSVAITFFAPADCLLRVTGTGATGTVTIRKGGKPANLTITNLEVSGNLEVGGDITANAIEVQDVTTVTAEVTADLVVGGTVDAANGLFSDIQSDTGDITNLTSDAVVVSTAKRLTASATNATATMANLTGLTVTLMAGTAYTGKLYLMVNEDVAADGITVDFGGGTATMTNFGAYGKAIDSAGSELLNVRTTAIATDFAIPSFDGDGLIEIAIGLVVNAGGTFIPRFSQAAHTTGTATVYLNSWLRLDAVS